MDYLHYCIICGFFANFLEFIAYYLWVVADYFRIIANQQTRAAGFALELVNACPNFGLSIFGPKLAGKVGQAARASRMAR